ncbi:hypothetical protein ACP4OV_008279 [Aristida adscensionis]
MAKVPDLGSDFAQKLLKDLRRRRERLGLEPEPPPASRRGGAANAMSRDAYSNSQKPLQAQKPRQAAPRVSRTEAAANRLHHQQSSSRIAGAGKPRRHDAPPAAGVGSYDIVPFQGAGGAQRPASGAAVAADVQMALALALSNSGKLQNVQLLARDGQRPPHGYHLLSPSAHVGKLAVEVQKLNDILAAYSSSAGGRRGSVEVGRRLLRGAMDLEESLSMLVMLQEASDYMATSASGKVLLLEGNESRRGLSRSSSSARLVEIVDEDPEAEKIRTHTANASMQIVPHSMSQSYISNHSSALQLVTVTDSSKGSGGSGGEKEKDSSKVRMPSLIAKLMGLENLPSAAKAAAERKGAERFVKPEALPRMAKVANAAACTLPIRIVASERMPSKGEMENFLARDWDISLTKSEGATFLFNRPVHPTTDKQTRQTMKQVLSKGRSSERRASLSEVVDVRMNREDMKLAEESKRQKPATVGCRDDAGKRMSFLQRFRKNASNKPVAEVRDVTVIQENNRTIGKKQTASMKLLLGSDSEMKSRRPREKLNKENLASSEAKAEGKNVKADQVRRQTQTKKTDKQNMVKKALNYRQMQSEEACQNQQDKRSPKSGGVRAKKKLEHNAPIEQKNGKHEEVYKIRSSEQSRNTTGPGGISEKSAEMKRNSISRGASSGQLERQTSEEILDPISTVAKTSDDSKILDQATVSEINADRMDHKVSETTQIAETLSEGERQQQQQIKEVKDQPRDGLYHTTKFSTLMDLSIQKMHVVSCDAFTENQLLLTEMLLKDQYLLETAKAIAGIDSPVRVISANTGNWLDKGNQVLSDIGREVIRRKCKRTEAMVDVSMACAAIRRSQSLDDLIRELDSDIQSLNIPNKPHQQSGQGIADRLKMILGGDIQRTHSDANSMWDFGWNRMSDLPIERNEVVKDLEKNILGGIITDVARELIEVSVHHRCCGCAA